MSRILIMKETSKDITGKTYFELLSPNAFEAVVENEKVNDVSEMLGNYQEQAREAA